MDNEMLESELCAAGKVEETDANGFVWDIFWDDQYGMRSRNIDRSELINDAKYNVTWEDYMKRVARKQYAKKDKPKKPKKKLTFPVKSTRRTTRRKGNVVKHAVIN